MKLISSDKDESGLDPEDDADLELDAIRLPANYRRVSSMASQDSVHRMEYDLDGLDDDLPEFLNFKDPLDDGDW